MNIEDLEIIQCDLIEENEKEEISVPQIKKEKPTKPEKYNPAIKPLFKNNFERYGYLMKYGCTSADDRNWLKDFKESKEYKFEQDFCSHYF